MAGLLSVGEAVAGTGSFSKVQSTSPKSGKDLKLERIINKFKSGKKLASGELSYIAKKDPPTFQKILRIMQKREQLEERLAAAETKEEAQQIMMQEMQSVETFCANSDDDFEKTALVSQMMDAYGELTKSDSYREKPDTNAELAEQKRKRMEDRSGQAEIEELQRKRKKKRKKNGNINSSDDEEENDTENFDISVGWNSLPREAISTEAEDSLEYEEYDPVETQTMDAVTYTAQGKKKSAEGFIMQSGTKVNVAL